MTTQTKTGKSSTGQEIAVERRNRPSVSFLSLFITVLVISVVTVAPSILRTRWETPQQQADSIVIIAVSLMIAVFQGIVSYFTIYFVGWLYYRLWQKKRIETEIGDLQREIETDFFTSLVKINFKYIDKYYLQTQVQADKSFILSVLAASASLIVTIVGIGMMYRGETTPAYVTTAAGVLGELIASIFFYLYNQTVIKMGEYHQKLVLTQNIGLALKITDELGEPFRSETRGKLVESLSKDINFYLGQRGTSEKSNSDTESS